MSDISPPALLVIYNPVCGHRKAKELFDAHVLPALRAAGREPTQVVATTHEGHAGEVVLQFLGEHEGGVDVVLGSGDGTLHEIVCALHEAPARAGDRRIHISLVPCGTANALYASLFPPAPDALDTIPWKLRSLDAFLRIPASTRALTFAVTTLSSDFNEASRSSVSAVVASTALHASILHDSEALRAQHPGIERFKLAAEKNLAKWYSARAALVASAAQPVQVYDPSAKRFVPYAGGGDAQLEGPFVYFLSTVNVDRLEPTFRIAPLHSAVPPGEAASVDVVVMRPLRGQPSFLDRTKIAEQQPARSMAVLGGAYKDGAHVDMRFNEKGDVVEGAADGEPVVEYFRCAGWEWYPEATDESAHFVCADGEILHVPPNGRASCKATRKLVGYTIGVHI